MTGPGQQIVFDRSIFTHENAYKIEKRMHAIDDLVAHTRNEIISRSAMHTKDDMTITVQVTVDDIDSGLVCDPMLKSYGIPLEPCLGDAAAAEAGRLFLVDEERTSLSSSIGFALSYACVFLFGALLAYGLSGRPTDSDLMTMTDQQLEVDLMYYQGMLHNASGSGCQMSIEEFRDYHELGDELAGRSVQ